LTRNTRLGRFSGGLNIAPFVMLREHPVTFSGPRILCNPCLR
jgi:hypothetical protein